MSFKYKSFGYFILSIVILSTIFSILLPIDTFYVASVNLLANPVEKNQTILFSREDIDYLNRNNAHSFGYISVTGEKPYCMQVDREGKVNMLRLADEIYLTDNTNTEFRCNLMDNANLHTHPRNNFNPSEQDKYTFKDFTYSCIQFQEIKVINNKPLGLNCWFINSTNEFEKINAKVE